MTITHGNINATKFLPGFKNRMFLRQSIALLITLATATTVWSQASVTTGQKVDDLLRQMTIEEKIGQMCQFMGVEQVRQNDDKSGQFPANSDSVATYPGLHAQDIEQMVRDGKVGSFFMVFTAKEADYLQSLAQESRLKIPLLIGTDAIHGNGLVSGDTVYPAPLSMASTFDDTLVERVAAEAALEIRASGSSWTFSPNVDVARDARWGRVGETFGEDPLLVGRMGSAMVRGYQGKDRPSSERVLACMKHLIAGSVPVNGLNGAPTEISERTLRSVFLPPYLECIKAGVGSLMTAHHDLNGVPCHANSWIMETLMRKEAGFSGFVVSDWRDIERLYTVHHFAASPQEAVYLSVKAGMDLHMHGPGFFEDLLQLVKAGRISEERIDQSVRRILAAKFQLGLFETNSIQVGDVLNTSAREEHRQTALEAARKGLVLLKNQDALLPINANRYKQILVTGPLADSPVILGDWVKNQPDESTITVLQGLRQVAPPGCNILFHDCGKAVKKTSPEAIVEARKLAAESDLVILVVGENSFRSAPYDKDRTSGENHDRSDIELPGQQLELARAVAASGKPVVVVLVNSRPIGSEWIADNIPAILEAWEPGCQGGLAVAEVLFGTVNPSGRLPITIPRSVGHIQSFYNYKPSQYFRGYVGSKAEPLYWFGHGLSYTTFKYSNLHVPAEIKPGQSVAVKVDVTNSGARSGDEVVLVYTHDVLGTVTTPVRELKAFTRVTLAPGETKTVEINIAYDQLALIDQEMKRVVEPGDFEVFVGNQKMKFTVLP